MNFKKTFWMNVFGGITWALFCLMSFATDIDYVEHTLTHKVIGAFVQLFVLAIFAITAFSLNKSNILLMRKLALLGNYCGLIGGVFYLLIIAYLHPSAYISSDLITIISVYLIFSLPCLLNIIILKKV